MKQHNYLLEFKTLDNEAKTYSIINTSGVNEKTFIIKGLENINIEELAAGFYFLQDENGKTAQFQKK